MDDDVLTFYDGLAGDYHLLFDDWWEAAVWHGDTVERLLHAAGVRPPARILDATCGIGTQALPLAARGYEVVGGDLSGRAIERARSEAAARGIEMSLLASDIRELGGRVAPGFDAAISFDNSLPHLPTQETLVTGLTVVRTLLAPGGIFLASVRDYDRLRADGVQGVTPVLHRRGDVAWISGQAWEWDATSVLIHLMVARAEGDGWRSEVRTTRYRALSRVDLNAGLAAAGLTDIEWLEPETTGFYQPVVAARAT